MPQLKSWGDARANNGAEMEYFRALEAKVLADERERKEKERATTTNEAAGVYESEKAGDSGFWGLDVLADVCVLVL